MVRLGAVFIAICIVLIALSIGAGGYLYFTLSAGQAAVLALACLAVLTLYNNIAARLRDRNEIGAQVADLSRGSADVARQCAELGRRLSALEAKSGGTTRSGSIAPPVAEELGELGALVKQLAETVAAHDAALNGAQVPSRPLVASPAPTTVPSIPPAARIVTPEPAAPVTDLTSPPPAGDDADAIAGVRDAVENGRIDLYLQPIVTLPQRKVRYYEALSRMRTPTGEIVTAAEFLKHAEAAGVMSKIDNLALLRSVKVVRRLMLKNREIGMFCNVSAATLADADFFPHVIDFVEANKALASALVFELSQATVRGLGAIEQESLAALAERGFRFSMDQVTDLRFEARDLCERGFRFVKVPAGLLLDQINAVGVDIHPADLADLLGRYGIDLIVSHIEREAAVVDLLDFDVRYGQGFLFSAPRPVRQDALRTGAERNEGVARADAVGDEKPGLRASMSSMSKPETSVLPPGGVAQLIRGAFGQA